MSEKIERGQGLTEYLLLIMLGALMVVGALYLFGTQLGGIYSNIIANVINL